MRAWKNLKQGERVLFAAEHGEFSCVCTVTDVSNTHVIARSPSGIDFWIDDDNRYLFKREDATE